VLGAWESSFIPLGPVSLQPADLHADAAPLGEVRDRDQLAYLAGFKDFGFKLVIWVFNGNLEKWLRE